MNFPTGSFKVVETTEQAEALLAKLSAMSGPFGIDCECIIDIDRSPVGQGTIVCWSVAWTEHNAEPHPRGMPLASRAFLWADQLELFRSWLEDPAVPKVGHNVFTFDRHLFANHGIALQGIVGDTLRMSRFLNADSGAEHGLKSLMVRVLGYEPVGDYKTLFGRNKSSPVEDLGEGKLTRRKVGNEFIPTYIGGEHQRLFDSVELIPLDQVRTVYPWLLPTLYDYASLDAKATLELFHFFRTLLRQRPAKRMGAEAVESLWDLYERWWNPGLLQLTEYERAGIDVSDDMCEAIAAKMDVDIAPLAAAVESWAPGVNWRSSKQYAQFLYGVKRFPIPPYCGSKPEAARRTKRGKTPGDFVALSWIADRVQTGAEDKAGLRAVLALKKLTNDRRFATDLPTFRGPDGRVHTILAPEADTGRLSSKAPCVHQLPKRDKYKVRKAVTAPTGYSLIVADYCVSLNTKILTSDLCWEYAGNIKVGQELVGFDEQANGRQGRRFKRTVVTGVKMVVKPGLVLTMCDGTRLQCSANHMWLARRSQSRLLWATADTLKVGDSLGYFGPTWETDRTREGGYLAGVLDGEGWVAKSGKVGFAQLPNPCLARAQAACTALGLNHRLRSRESDAVQSVEFYGNKAGLSVLGSLRPSRLLPKAHLLWEGKRVWSAHLPQRRIVHIDDVGERNYMAIETEAKTFIADGYLSHNCQLEMYVAAHFMNTICGDDTLATFLQNGDMHSSMALRAWPHELAGLSAPEVKAHIRRDHAKAVGYGLFYGKSAAGMGISIRDQTGEPIGTAAAQAILDAYHAAVPSLAKLQRYFIEYAREHWGVHTLLGRFRPISAVHSDEEYIRGEGERAALNTPIQGSAHDIVASAMLRTNTSRLHELTHLGYFCRPLADLGAVGVLQVHDELQWRVPSEGAHQAAAWIKDLMENPLPAGVLSLPLKADVAIAPSWGDAK